MIKPCHFPLWVGDLVQRYRTISIVVGLHVADPDFLLGHLFYMVPLSWIIYSIWSLGIAECGSKVKTKTEIKPKVGEYA